MSRSHRKNEGLVGERTQTCELLRQQQRQTNARK